MEEKKTYTQADVEELYFDLGDWAYNNDGSEKLEELFSKYNVSNHELFYTEVLAGGLPGDQVCTPKYCKEFCEGMIKIKEELNASK